MIRHGKREGGLPWPRPSFKMYGPPPVRKRFRFDGLKRSASMYPPLAEVGELSVGIVSPPDISINFRKAREIGLEIPFSFFESASFVYDYEGRIVRQDGRPVQATN